MGETRERSPALPRPEGVNYSIKINFLTLSRKEQEQRILNPPKSSKVAVKEFSTRKEGGGGEKPQELTEEKQRLSQELKVLIVSLDQLNTKYSFVKPITGGSGALDSGQRKNWSSSVFLS